MAHQILLVDDDPLVLKTIERALTTQGYIVETANNAKEVLERIREKEFDLVVSDVRIPGIDGIECVRYIREFELKVNRGITPEILITGYTDEKAHERADSLAIRDYVKKPFDITEFLDVVRLRLSQRKPARRGKKYRESI